MSNIFDFICRGEEVHTDARPIISNAKNQSDMLLAYSTLPGNIYEFIVAICLYDLCF